MGAVILVNKGGVFFVPLLLSVAKTVFLIIAFNFYIYLHIANFRKSLAIVKESYA